MPDAPVRLWRSGVFGADTVGAAAGETAHLYAALLAVAAMPAMGACVLKKLDRLLEREQDGDAENGG